MTLQQVITYLKKNWPHISTSITAIIVVAYDYITTKVFTYQDLVTLLMAFGLMSTTNSGTIDSVASTPPEQK